MTAPLDPATADLTAKLREAEQRVDDLLLLQREARRLEHRVRIARMKGELIGLSRGEQEDLEDEIADYRKLVAAFKYFRRDE